MSQSRNPTCTVCGHNPSSMNNAKNECSHCDCPSRRKCWSEGRDEYIEAMRAHKANDNYVPSLYDQMFDRSLD